MRRFQAFKFELRPTGEQQRQMLRFAGSCRFVYNKALALQQANYEAGGKFISYVDMAKRLTEWRNGAETPWLREASRSSQQGALKSLDGAYANFFAGRTAYPHFKKRGPGKSLRFPDGGKIHLDQVNNRIKLPKLGWIRYRNSRKVVGEVRSTTVSQSGDKWYVSILARQEVPDPVHPSTSVVGIDLGITRFATLSDGSFVEPVNALRKHQKRLACYQRSVSRKVKFSQNWKKAKKKVQRLHIRIANIRKDFLHKTSTTISKNHAIVVLEDLRVQKMSASAAGNIETPGKNVQAKSDLNRSILDQGWSEFRRQLEYKQAWRGGRVIVVPPQNTSRTCPFCGYVSAENRKTQARFACTQCGYENHADLVGAINILAAGHAVIACGESVLLDRSTKQEPSEVSQSDAV